MHRQAFLLIVSLFTIHVSLQAQDAVFSLPQKINTGYVRTQILGKTSQGILVYLQTRTDEQISCYYDDLQLHWNKKLSPKEKHAHNESIMLTGDSLIFFYTVLIKGDYILKAYKTSAKLEPLHPTVICDTLEKNYLSVASQISITAAADKKSFLVYYTMPSFTDNPAIYSLGLNEQLKLQWKGTIKLNDITGPEIIDAASQNNREAYFIIGETTSRISNNDFPYTAFRLIETDGGKKTGDYPIKEPNEYLSRCISKTDLNTGDLIVAGVYADEIGNESRGTYFFRFSFRTDSFAVRHLNEYPNDLLIQLSGNNPPKKSDGFYDFRPRDLIVRNDGGAILITESFSETNDSYSRPAYGSFGITSGFTINYFHYDEMAVFSIMPDGSAQWQQILHKKQQTEGDGGFYSSFISVTGPGALHFIFNDMVNGQVNVTGYRMDGDGKQERHDYFNAERKAVMVIPKQAKQISANELLLPSVKRNYLQFVKLTLD